MRPSLNYVRWQRRDRILGHAIVIGWYVLFGSAAYGALALVDWWLS